MWFAFHCSLCSRIAIQISVESHTVTYILISFYFLSSHLQCLTLTKCIRTERETRKMKLMLSESRELSTGEFSISPLHAYGRRRTSKTFFVKIFFKLSPRLHTAKVKRLNKISKTSIGQYKHQPVSTKKWGRGVEQELRNYG